jgi:hypothetical protein
VRDTVGYKIEDKPKKKGPITLFKKKEELKTMKDDAISKSGF